jgi:hypothetical protein
MGTGPVDSRMEERIHLSDIYPNMLTFKRLQGKIKQKKDSYKIMSKENHGDHK